MKVQRLFLFSRMKSLRRVGIFGGSFDPVHRGHGSLAAAALKEQALDAVIFGILGHP
jgi:nicotinate-nucleotide adenylyltransferase